MNNKQTSFESFFVQSKRSVVETEEEAYDFK